MTNDDPEGPARTTGSTATPALGGVDIAGTLRFITYLPGDPTVAVGPTRLVRATRTPEGAGTLLADWSSHREVRVEAWGPGADWLVERSRAHLGLDDDPGGFEPDHQRLREAHRRHAGLRVPRTGTIWHDLAWFVVQQRVTTEDAARSWRQLTRAYGDPAPGPFDLYTPPSPERLAAAGYADLHRFGLERSRATTLIGAAREIPRFERSVDGPFTAVERRLGALSGIGPWTQGGVAASTFGDADAVILGDVGIPHAIAWFLAGEEWADDRRMVELLEPFRPHRFRVLQLVMAAGGGPPKRRPTRYGTNDIRRR